MLSTATVEKVVLLGLLVVVFGSMLPGVHLSSTQTFVSVAVLVVVNAAIILAAARRSISVESTGLAFGIRVVVNGLLVLLADWLLGLGPGDIDPAPALFFLILISLITTLHDRWTPVRDYRLATQ